MTWLITHKPSYDTDFIDLSKDLQKQATQAHADLEQDPVTPRGNTVKKLKGWDNLWRYRLGRHRLIYAALPENKVVQLLAIGPRADIYRRFNYNPDAEEPPALSFSPELAAGLEPAESAGPEWLNHPEWFRPAAPEPTSDRLPRKLTPELLLQWRIPAEHHPPLIRCQTEDDLYQAQVPDVILGRLLDALWPPAVDKIAGQPDQVLFQPEDLEKYIEGTLRGFLLHLDPDQRRYVDWALSGPTLVKGGPGSGKSTVALYRVRAIVEHARQNNSEVPTILFTTYTNPLINFSESLLHQLLADVLDIAADAGLPKAIKITTVDKMAMWIARRSGRRFNIASAETQHEALHYARAAQQPADMADLDQALVQVAVQNLRDDYLLEEFDWIIEGQNCQQVDDYLNAHRAGRAIPFSQALRSAVWQLYQAYHRYLAEQNLLTWGQLRQLALEQVQSNEFTERWDYVLVDEAQDLPPLALALCVELCRDPSGLFLTADANQSLYNRGFRWQNVHDQLKVTGRTRILRRNYRSTRDIAQAAADLLLEGNNADAEALRQTFLHTGPAPVIYAADGATDQARWLAEQIYHATRDLHLPINAAAVLVPSNKLAQPLVELLKEQGLPAKYMRSSNVHLEERCVKVITLHAAKGLEFPIVALAHVEADRLPKEIEANDEQDREEHLAAQRRLFYVGCTRAMRYLFVTYDRSIPSIFLTDLSEDRWLHF